MKSRSNAQKDRRAWRELDGQKFQRVSNSILVVSP